VLAATPATQKNSGARKRHVALRIIALLCAAFLILVGVLYFKIARQAGMDESRPADVIVVFGAAEYSGKPSPAYKRRLDHAAELYRRGLAPMIITSGGAGRDPHYSEGQVGRDYLMAHGIPEDRVIAETQGEDTLESTARLAAIMRENGMKTCLAASDGYHMFRIKRMMQRQGITTYAAPNLSPHSEHMAMLEEVFKFLAWKMRLEDL
jgi:uncharacterized SAM-binding protein YcdF (DUF218 family)